MLILSILMIEFMNFKCKKCGYWVDSSKDEYEEREGLCEGCFESKDE